MEYKGYNAVVTYDNDLGILHGEVIDTRDVITFQGRSVDDLQEAFENSVDDYLKLCEERGREPDKPFSGKVALRMDPETHRMIVGAARSGGKSLNTWIVDAIGNELNRGDEVSEKIMYTFARTAVRDALDDAIEATGATDWGGNTGCFPTSSESFDKYWQQLRGADSELSTTAALSILNALLEGTHCELTRLGGDYAPAVLRHIKENLGETLGCHSVTINDDTACGDIWYATRIMVDHYLDRVIPDAVAQHWDERLANQPR